MDINFNNSLKFTLTQEGGWSNNPRDPGGATMCGVTLAVYRAWKHNPAITPTQLRNISQADLNAIYKQNYWDASQCGLMPTGVDLMVFDMAVNAGVSRSAKLLQATVGAVADGQIGPKTMALVNAANPAKLINGLSQHQLSFYQSLSTFDVFGDGWTNRINARHAAALSLIANAPAVIHKAIPVATQLIVSDQEPNHFFVGLKALV